MIIMVVVVGVVVVVVVVVMMTMLMMTMIISVPSTIALADLTFPCRHTSFSEVCVVFFCSKSDRG